MGGKTIEAFDGPDQSWGQGETADSASGRATVAVRYRIGGLTRYLSHAETLRVFRRACARAAIPVRFSQGFNPHPRLSAPLPRSVAVASDDECLLMRLDSPDRRGLVGLRDAIDAVLPRGIEVFAVEPTPAATAWRPRSALYQFPLGLDPACERVDRLNARIANVLSRTSLVLERRAPGRRPSRCVDVRPFLMAARYGHGALTVRCRISNAGTVRVDEMMQVFELKTEDLAGPVRRVSVAWDRRA